MSGLEIKDVPKNTKKSNGDVWVRRLLAITKLVAAIAPIIIVIYTSR